MDTFKSYLKIQGQMFVYGVVGPIFLLLYFAISPNDDVKWMYWSGLLITAADVLIALGITERRVQHNRTAR
ncbi:hypothetical protein [Mycobacterium sp. C31M]